MTNISPHHHGGPGTRVFAKYESRVQSYARSFPRVFGKAEGVRIFDVQGNPYLDFLAGAGSLNYGHNHPVLTEALTDYIKSGGITHSLDLHTEAKGKFLSALHDRILEPRDMDYVAQFTGPTGTNAVEAAFKLARRVKGRPTIVSFTNGFHGVTLGALAATGNSHHRAAAGLPALGVVSMPYDGYLGPTVNTAAYLRKMIADRSSGLDHPAAIVVETVQGEGGLNTASSAWLRELRQICDEFDMLLIVDDIQAGCGRTGTFFSFEAAGIKPDIITLSKSLSGFGLPFALVLIARDLDQWQPGEHNGTFRGNNHAFVTATAALEHFWRDRRFTDEIARKSATLSQRLTAIADQGRAHDIAVRGRGMMQGLVFPDGKTATAVSQAAYRRGLIIETGGPEGEVVKCLCPLVISPTDLTAGLDILADSVAETMNLEQMRRKLHS